MFGIRSQAFSKRVHIERVVAAIENTLFVFGNQIEMGLRNVNRLAGVHTDTFLEIRATPYQSERQLEPILL